jgi:uncharacterized membrane protein YtjA (UPF0391 family)
VGHVPRRVGTPGFADVPVGLPRQLLKSVTMTKPNLRPPESQIEELAMLHYAVVFFIIALIAAVLGFGGIAAGAAGIAKILFIVFLVLAIASFFFGRGRGGL